MPRLVQQDSRKQGKAAGHSEWQQAWYQSSREDGAGCAGKGSRGSRIGQSRSRQQDREGKETQHRHDVLRMVLMEVMLGEALRMMKDPMDSEGFYILWMVTNSTYGMVKD